MPAWVESHIEDAIDREVIWDASGPSHGETSFTGTNVFSHFGLSLAICWKARARVSRNDRLELLFGHD